MSPAKTAEVDTPNRPYMHMMEKMHSQAAIESSVSDGTDAFEIASQVVDKIAVAETLDDIFDANESGMDKAKQYIGMPLTLTELGFSKSQEKFRKGNLGVFCKVDAVLDDGREVSFSVGATNVVASLFRIQEIGLMSKTPRPRVVIKGTETANGTLYKLGKP